MPKDVVVVGSLNADLVMKVKRLPRPGETVKGSQLQIVGGGKGANQAVAAARLGAPVSMIGSVGADDYGALLLKELQASGVSVQFVRQVKGVQTGLALILVDEAGGNQIAISGGANDTVTPDQVKADLQASPPPRVCLLQLEIPLESVIAAAQRAKSLGALVILDPAPASPLPRELLASVDLITPNETETAVLTGLEVTDETSARSAAEQLLSQGVQAAIIKMGDKGAFLLDSSGAHFVPALDVAAVDTTAAGDAFNGAVAAAVSGGLSLLEALRFANVVGALTVTKPGAIPSLPRKEDVLQFVSQRPELAHIPLPDHFRS